MIVHEFWSLPRTSVILHEKYHMLGRSQLLEREIRDKPEWSPSKLSSVFISLYIHSPLKPWKESRLCGPDPGLSASLIISFVYAVIV